MCKEAIPTPLPRQRRTLNDTPWLLRHWQSAISLLMAFLTLSASLAEGRDKAGVAASQLLLDEQPP